MHDSMSRGRRRGRLARFASLAAVLALVAVPALAVAGEGPSIENKPEEVPPSYSGTENPGSEYMPEGLPVPETIPPEYSGSENPGAESRPEGVPVPEEVPPGYSGTENPGMAHVQGSVGTESPSHPSGGQARALGREQCQDWKQNFADNRSQFGKCIADVAKALRTDMAPGRACADMNRRPEAGEHRSDFSACVAAAAKALRESD